MTTEAGRAYAIGRMVQCPDLEALRRVWESLSDDYKRDPKIHAFKERIKESLK